MVVSPTRRLGGHPHARRQLKTSTAHRGFALRLFRRHGAAVPITIPSIVRVTRRPPGPIREPEVEQPPTSVSMMLPGCVSMDDFEAGAIERRSDLKRTDGLFDASGL
jgi:hypothetical protein